MANISFEFDPWAIAGERAKKGKVAATKEEIKDFVLNEILDYVARGSSPVSRGPWKKSLSKEYKKRKAEESSVSFANLELTGELLDHLVVQESKGGKLKVTVTGGADVKAKAEGNNIGSYGKSPDDNKARRFIPKEGETFKSRILQGIKEIVKDANAD